jgi:ubiquinone/menaquinone biosynthesis C-methylase UbiE
MSDASPHAESMPVEDRLRALFTHLGLGRAHVAGGYAADAVTLARGLPEHIASLMLVCPFRLPAEPFRPLGDRLLLVSGDRGPNASSVPRFLTEMPLARSLTLRDYADAAWSDAVADRRATIQAALSEFHDDLAGREAVAPVQLSPGSGQVAGVTYAVRGSGPPLVLLPLSLARSQWTPLLDELSQRYTTIVLGGGYLGFVPTLEDRMRGGYRDVVRSVVDAARPQPGERIGEIGCGSGAVARWLASYTAGGNPITAVDVNAYLLGEAASLTSAQGLSDRISFELGDAEALPLPSDSFDVTLSFTVMEEVDADRMLAELVRVTRPGGRVGVVVRGTDMAPWINLPFSEAMRQAVAVAPGAGADERGCADASLYRRFVEVGLHSVAMGPQLGAEIAQRSPERLRFFTARIAQSMPNEQAREFRDMVKAAVADGTMVWAEPYHCAVGVKE